MSNTLKTVTDTASSVLSPIKTMHNLGIKSDYLFLAGFASIGVAIAAWGVSRAKPDDDKPQADRWGIFVGHWPASFFALGLALQHEEGRFLRR